MTRPSRAIAAAALLVSSLLGSTAHAAPASAPPPYEGAYQPKGVDEIARKIRERAAEHGVPIHSDPPTARAIHATVEIGQEIRVEHYRAVAAAIRFAEAMRRRVRRR